MTGRTGSAFSALTLLALLAGCKQPEPPPPPPPVEKRVQPEVSPAPDAVAAPEQPVEQKPEPTPDASVSPDVPAEVVDKGPKGIARFKMSETSETAGPVDFRHRKHQKQYGCKKCHHEIKPGEIPASCGSCHGPQEEICDLQTSFHKTCNPCHNSMGMGPVKCAACHKWIKKKKKKEPETE